MDDDRQDMEQRLVRLEAAVARITEYLRLDAQDAALRERAAVTKLVAPPAAPSPAIEPAAQAAFVRNDAMKAEDFLGGRVLLGAGALTLILGVSFFIRYAFDNGWIGPAGRVAIGLLAGIALVAASQRFRNATRTIFADAVTGIGGAILYLSLWGAGNAFHLVPLAVSFGAMMIVTASLMVLAQRSGSQVTIAFALLGGFLTPALNETATPAFTQLFIYLAILDAGLLFAPGERRWPIIAPASLLLTQLYVADAYHTSSDPMALYLVAAAGYFALFLARPLRNAFARRALLVDDAVVVVFAASAFYGTLHAELFASHRYWLTASVVALAAAFVFVARRTEAQWRTVFGAIALALITGGVAVTFTGDIITVLWIAEATALLWVGLQQRMAIVRAFGYAGLVLAFLAVLVDPPQTGPAFFNEQFVTFASFAVGFFVVRFAAARFADAVEPSERSILSLSEPVGHLTAIVGLSIELDHASSHNELALTLFWIAYAAGLLAYGLARGKALARWEGFVVLTIAVLKAFAIDMAAVNPGIRIISFLALGSMMLGFSYVYQRAMKRAAP